jgi:cell division protein FtsZ
MKEAGMAVMGTGSASGPNRAEEAALAAINSPLIENSSITGAKGILINITGNIDLGLHEISQATTLISQNASEDANIILGSAIDSSLKDEIVITVIATGFQRSAQKVDIKSNMSETFAKPAMSDASQIMASKADSSMSNINGSTKEADEIKIDLNDFDTPAFMRKKAARDLSSENNLE